MLNRYASTNCGHMKALENDLQRYHKLIEALDLPVCKLNVEEMDKLKSLQFDFSDMFAWEN